MSDVDKKSYEDVLKYGSYAEASRRSGVPTTTLKDRCSRYMLRNNLPSPLGPNDSELAESVGKGCEVLGGTQSIRMSESYLEPEELELPESGSVNRYFLTCAQNNTEVYEQFWNNLIAYADYHDARIMVSRFTYAKGMFQSGKPGTSKNSDKDETWYAEEVVPYLSDNSVQLAPGIVWCGELNILPTAVRPLSGLATYTRTQSMVVPHVKVAMESYAVRKGDDPRFGYTTGSVTQRNYIQKKAGQKAEFHHVYGALLVEVDSDGSWWARQINADSDGNFHDLDVSVADGLVSHGNSVETITWGDIHCGQLNDETAGVSWGGRDSMSAVLRPRFQLFHDVLDFLSRNHHDEGDPHRNYAKFVAGKDDAETEVRNACKWLHDRKHEAQEWLGDVVVVASNHDDFLVKWLKKDAYRTDPLNAVFFLETQLAYYKSIRDRFNGVIPYVVKPFEWAYRRWFGEDEVRFLREDDTFVRVGIEHALHGHLGPNGIRGNKSNLLSLGVRINIGHSHVASIVDGVYQSGTSTNIDMGYNKGASSWSHSHIVTYTNGKRAIVTFRNGKWRA